MIRYNSCYRLITHITVTLLYNKKKDIKEFLEQ